MFFALDGEQVGPLSLDGISYHDYFYNYLAYSNSSIEIGNHTFVLQNGKVGASMSLVLLDYILYS